ncbi:hypothetical protein G6F64_000040 [Rhizopus arrhizus]|uniref:Uncharacterized protein n=1 Tax=Rhizopus oryzae TaxID=64495 RepID=A0A9P6XKQ3_RHIOR|nr:hypothetical protein G6F64_000040 [Rhizopus arrhizus]
MWWMRTELSRWILLLSCLLTSSRTPSLRNTSKRPSSPTIDERKVDLESGDPFDSDDEKTRCLKQRHQTEHVLTVRMTPIYLQHIRMARLNALRQHHLSNNQGSHGIEKQVKGADRASNDLPSFLVTPAWTGQGVDRVQRFCEYLTECFDDCHRL